ncbi:hypothetical protein B0H14DRAFT_3896747 [Mycena olivaceomarginata]|nr:hypothetical protein B0H14DRAFT_3896747 [Mycena olivaceomarginata]
MAHSIYFIRDSLFFCMFEKAVSFADPGQLIRVLKYWGLAFGAWDSTTTPANVPKSWYGGSTSSQISCGVHSSGLEQLNFWGQGSGVTVDYIIRKGSACVEAFRDITHMVANFFGDPDRARRSKEVRFHQDIEALVTEMQRRKFHVVSQDQHFVPAPPKKPPRSAIVDVFVKGAEEWNGKFADFIKSTTFDPALGGYPPPSESSTSATMIYMAAKMEYRVH